MKNASAARNGGIPASVYPALALSVLSVGGSSIIVRWADAPGIVSSFYRMAIATALLAGPFIRRASRGGGVPRQGLTVAAAAGILFAADLGLWATGVMTSGATNPTLLANLAPLWVGLGAILLFRERLGGIFWAGLALALTGAAVILGLDGLRSLSAGVGTFLGLLAGLFYAAYLLLVQRGMRTLDPLTCFWPAAASSAAALLAACIALRAPLAGYPPSTWLCFIALGVLPQAIGYLAVNHALRHLPASIVSPTLLGQPVMTIVLAAVLLDEKVTIASALGCLLVVAGIAVVHRSRQAAAPAESRDLTAEGSSSS